VRAAEAKLASSCDKVEYFVEWKGRLKKENSWEKAAIISRKRIIEFEAS